MREKTAARSRSIDMLNGSLLDKIILFALPLAAASILQQLFNAADIAVVGRFSSNRSMAAVGSNSSMISLLIGLFMGMSVGANVLVARLIGEGRKEKLRTAVHTVIALALICGVGMAAVGSILSRQMLRMMNTPEDVMPLADLYLRIYFLGMPFILLYNFGAAILRSKGDSRSPLLCLSAGGAANVVLNLLLVVVFHLDVAGVAIATVVSNVISSALILYRLVHEEESFRLDIRQLKIHGEHLKKILQVGIPAGLQGMVFSFSNVVIQAAINSFGADAAAGSTAGQNFEFIVYFIVAAFSQSAVTFTSQNYGARKLDRCRRIYQLCMVTGLTAALAAGILFALFRFRLLRIFTTDEKVIYYAAIRILIVGTLDFLTGTYEISAGAMRGMGYAVLPTILTLLGSCVLRLFWVGFVFPLHRNFTALMVVYPVSWIVTGTAVIASYLIVRSRAFSRMEETAV